MHSRALQGYSATSKPALVAANLTTVACYVSQLVLIFASSASLLDTGTDTGTEYLSICALCTATEAKWVRMQLRDARYFAEDGA